MQEEDWFSDSSFPAFLINHLEPIFVIANELLQMSYVFSSIIILNILSILVN